MTNKAQTQTGFAPLSTDNQYNQIGVHTASGGFVPLLAPLPHHICITDIAEGLAKQCRFHGQLTSFYSNAQHACLVMRLLPDDFKPYGLFYNAHKAFIGEITSNAGATVHTRPVKKLIRNLDESIHRAMGLTFPIPNDVKQLIYHASHVAFATENRDLLINQKRNDALPSPAKFTINPWPWPLALEKFMEAVHECTVLHPDMTRSTAFKNHTNQQDSY